MNSILPRIIVFTRTVKTVSGGMDVHLQQMMSHMSFCISRDEGLSVYENGSLRIELNGVNILSILDSLVCQVKPVAFFFNDLSFIKHLRAIKSRYTGIQMILRSGGNDIYRAPLDDDSLSLKFRQAYIRDAINASIDIFIVNSDYSFQRSVQFGVNPRIIKKVRGGVNTALCNELVGMKTQTRSEFDSLYGSTGLTLFTFACRMKVFKGIVPFLDIFLQHPIRQKSFLLFIGDGALRKSIQEKISESSYSDHVFFMGEIPNSEVLRWISCSDYVVNPSIGDNRQSGDGTYIHTETMGRTMMEALVLGVPIVASMVGGTSELFFENDCVGYSFRDDEQVQLILDQIAYGKKRPVVSLSVDYSWNHVIEAYELFINKGDKDALVLDLDGTIVSDSVDLFALATELNKHRDRFILILNTARELDEETRFISQILDSDYIITENGLHIYSEVSSFMWNERDFLSGAIVSEAEVKEQIMKDKFPMYEVKRTHPHIIQLLKGSDFDADDLDTVEQVVSYSSYEYVHCNGLMKVYCRDLSKDAALKYILKGLNCNRIIAAGNSLNDYIFVRNSDIGWIESSLSSLVDKPSIETFEKDEVGLSLLKRIFKKSGYE